MDKGQYNSKIKVLIVDSDNQLARHLSHFIKHHGFECALVNNVKDAKCRLLEWHPKVVISDLLLADGNALEILKFIKADESLRHDFTTFMVMSAHNSAENIKQAINKGVTDYIIKPFQFNDVLKRLVYHCRSFRRIKEVQQQELDSMEESSLMLHLTNLVLKQALIGKDLEGVLFNLTRMLSMKLDGVRCNIVDCVNDNKGVVVTSNDNKAASGINLDLTKYPEILHVRNTQMMIAIENLGKDKHLAFIKEYVKDIFFNSIVVCPVFKHGDFFGVLSLKLPETKLSISDDELRFIEIVSYVVSLCLSSQNHSINEEFWLDAA